MVKRLRTRGLAAEFVRGIRDGVLHEAKTRKRVIWRIEPAGRIVAQEDVFALNRTLEAVKEELESYLKSCAIRPIRPSDKGSRK